MKLMDRLCHPYSYDASVANKNVGNTLCKLEAAELNVCH